MRWLGLALLALVACRAAAPARETGPDAVFARVGAGVDLDGAPVRLVAGEPTIFVVFASWCGHCRRELEVLAQLRARHPGVQVVGLNAYEDWEDTSDETQLRAFLAADAPWLVVVRSDAAMLRDLGGVPKIPSLFVYDGQGRLVERWKRHERRPPTLQELEAVLLRTPPARPAGR